jgi:hypothetical protein
VECLKDLGLQRTVATNLDSVTNMNDTIEQSIGWVAFRINSQVLQQPMENWVESIAGSNISEP